MDALTEKLTETLQGDVASDAATLDEASRDASLFRVRPKLVIFPKNTEDVKNLVRIVTEANHGIGKRPHFSLTARAAGTDMTGGPLTESIVVSFTRYFNHIKSVDMSADTAVVEPGVYYRDFDKATFKKGLILPSYTASRDLNTVGGMVANNSGGEKNLNYGKTERYILELKMVLRDGNEYVFKRLTVPELEEKKKLQTIEGGIYREIAELIEKNSSIIAAAKPQVSKNSAGYYLWNVVDRDNKTFDMTKLLVGSQGTLGLITEIKFGLVEPRTHSRMLVIFLKDMKNLGEITKHLLTFKPESLESYDDHTFKLAVKLFPQMVKKMGMNVFALGLKFMPEFWAVLTGGIPKLVILAEFTGETDEDAYRQAIRAQKELDDLTIASPTLANPDKRVKPQLKAKVTTSSAEVQKYWTIRRESFNMLRQHVKELRTAPFIDDFVVRPDILPEFLPKLYAILDQYNITYTIAGHVGDGNFHIIPLMDFAKPETTKIISDLGHKVYNLIIQYKGSITGEHNDGIIRTPFLEEMYGPKIIELFAKVKKIFDPDTIFNPGKKVGGTWDYAMKHLDTPENK
jgi:FAD/FMN-containing dehydrogenase